MMKIIAILAILFTTGTVLTFSSYSRINRVVSPVTVINSFPAPLSDMKAQTEDIIENVSKKNWEKVIQDLKMITSDWSTFQPQAVMDGIAPAILDSLSLTVVNLHKTCNSQDIFAATEAANDLSGAVVDLFCFYHSVVPVDIEYLNILERQILLDVQMRNWNATEQALLILSDVWRRIEPFFIEQIGYSLANKFSESMKNLYDAFKIKDSMAIQLETQNGLKIIDELKMEKSL